MTKPVALDLYSRKGGATVGYQRAGYRVIAVDIELQPGQPADEFFQFDALGALDALAQVGAVHFPLSGWVRPAIIHTSPPCQEGNACNIGTNAVRGNAHPQLVGPTRDLLEKIGIPYVIEQPTSSRKNLIRRDVTLCMDMFKGSMPPPWVQKHRSFELGGMSAEVRDLIKSNVPRHVKHAGRVRGWRHGEVFEGPYVAAYGKGGGKATGPEAAHAMQIDWMWTDSPDPNIRERERFDLCEAIPPAYTEWLGRQLIAAS